MVDDNQTPLDLDEEVTVEAEAEDQPQAEAQPEPADAQPANNASLIGTTEDSRFGKLRYTSIKDEMEKSYLDYAMSVIVSRALPDVRDGLKPVHRRILYSMYRSGIHHTSSYKKSARIVGDVLGKYHPHGDAPVYQALVRLAQDFAMRYQLIDGQGNFGSVDGDSPAAMRYTEARMAKISKELLGDIDKATVPFVDNFDGSLQEPTVLPSKLPNLLLMGAEGIAVGMATKIPPNNLMEVCEAIGEMIEHGSAEYLPDAPKLELPEVKIDAKASVSLEQIKARSTQIDTLMAAKPAHLAGRFQTETTIDQIMEHIKGPDFPTGGIIYDFEAIKEAYRTGRGRVVIRAKAKIEESKTGSYQIIVTELPYQVNKARLLEKIANLVRDKKIEGIRDLNDDSDRVGMQITIDLKRDARPKVILNKLFKYCELQTTFPVNMVALTSEGTPQLMNVRQILMEFIAHRQLMIVKRSLFELDEARARAHILEGLLIALKNLDEVIATIRKSADTEVAKEALMKKFGLSEIQSSAILEMQLKRLAALERQKIEDEYKTIQEAIGKLITLLSHPNHVLQVIKDETAQMVVDYGDDRRTQLIKGKVGEFNEEDLVPNEPTVITLTDSGYIKRMNPGSLRGQARGGKGSIGVKMKTEDMVKFLLSCNTHDMLFVFTNQGRVYQLKTYEIPEAKRQAKGTAMVNLLNLKPDERVQSILTLDEKADVDKFVTLATKDGLVKKTPVKLYSNIRQNGIIAITLNDGDELVWSKLTSGSDDLMLITHDGKSIRFSEKEVKSSNRDTKGVKGITVRKDDYVIGVETLSPTDDLAPEQAKKRHLLVVTENGMGKRTALDQYPVQKRSGMGVKVSEVTARTGKIAAARKITEEHYNVVITTKDGQTIKLPLDKASLPILSRPTQGVILMRLNNVDKVVAVALTFAGVEEGE